METNKILSALSYFSILFAGFLFPLVVYFITDHREVKEHAKKAFLSHLIPFISFPFFFVIMAMGAFQANSATPVLFIIGMVGTVLINFVVLVWNIVKGIKVLKEK